ncbi:MAG: DUF1501 domain-containing protein [Halieaceae bacterium]
MNRPHHHRFSRRRFLRASATGLGALAASPSFRVWGSSLEPYQGKLLFTLQLDGGADVTQLCDPKVNTPGERKINHWADNADPGEWGYIRYAPVADNARLFNRFGADMLVVNGVDAQTGSHETGKLFNWTGSNAEGLPSITAMHAAAKSPDQPLAYSVFGGSSRTAGLITYNRFDDVSRLRELTDPTRQPWNPQESMRPEEELVRSRRLVTQSISDMFSNPDLTPRQRRALSKHQDARSGQEGLSLLAESLPNNDDFQNGENFNVGNWQFFSNLKQQMQGAMLVMKAGLGSAADLSLNGFDSHENHDPIHAALYVHLSDALHFFWDYAESLGIADRILLLVGSDFGRTNMYNDGNGKDHWNIGSYMLMEQGAPWGGRVVGATDELHFARAINPTTLELDSRGVVITPAHVHKATRSYLGLDATARLNGLDLNSTEDIPLFDPGKMTYL